MSGVQKSFDLYADKIDKPLPPFEPRKKIPLPPRPGTKKKLFHHFAFDRVNKALPVRAKARPEPQQVDTRRFIQSKVMPFPEWPLICKLTNMFAFDSVKDGKAWLGKFNADSRVQKTWECGCGKTHLLCYPLEVSGQSSGKAFRRISWCIAHGYEYTCNSCNQKVTGPCACHVHAEENQPE
jgi:hypothetical protein